MEWGTAFSLAGAAFLKDPLVMRVFEVLGEPLGETRLVGGVVRDALLGKVGTDLDMATVHPPEEVMTRLGTTPFRIGTVGLSHGTVTVFLPGPFPRIEITSLRRDVSPMGRRSGVAFGADWYEDALRRDFTMNAIYCDGQGRIFDPLGDGTTDLLRGCVRFIGDPKARIEEDYLRILRFFRFSSDLGRDKLHAPSLEACCALKERLQDLSAERVRQEWEKLLVTKRVDLVLKKMSEVGILDILFRKPHRLSAFAAMMEEDRRAHRDPDMLLLLAVLFPNGARKNRLPLSRRERRVFKSYKTTPPPGSFGELCWLSYIHDLDWARGFIRILCACATRGAQRRGWRAMGVQIDAMEGIPPCPVSGKDLLVLGYEGPTLGRLLETIQRSWALSCFKKKKRNLLEEVGVWSSLKGV